MCDNLLKLEIKKTNVRDINTIDDENSIIIVIIIECDINDIYSQIIIMEDYIQTKPDGKYFHNLLTKYKVIKYFLQII